MAQWYTDLTQEELLHTFLTKHNVSRDSVQKALSSGITLMGPNSLRRSLAKKDFLYFMLSYFKGEFTIPFADIHYTLLEYMNEIAQRAMTNRPGINVALALPRG